MLQPYKMCVYGAFILWQRLFVNKEINKIYHFVWLNAKNDTFCDVDRAFKTDKTMVLTWID